MGVDLAAILIAGVGLGVAAASVVEDGLPRLVPARFGAGRRRRSRRRCSPSASSRRRGPSACAYDQRGAATSGPAGRDATDGADLDKLVASVKTLGGGRVYAGLRGNWGKTTASAPSRSTRGSPTTTSTRSASRSGRSVAVDGRRGGVRRDEPRAVPDAQHPVPDPARRASRRPCRRHCSRSSGRHRLYEVQDERATSRSSTGRPPITANRTDVEQQTPRVPQLRPRVQNVYPGVAFAGGPAPPPTFTGSTPPAGLARHGRLAEQRSRERRVHGDRAGATARPSCS